MGVKFFCLFFFFLTISPLANAALYDDPSCDFLSKKWSETWSVSFHIPDADRILDENCDEKQASLAFGVDVLEHYLPELYARVLTAKQIVLAGPSPDESVADTEAETGLISIYDSLLQEDREYIAAQLAHESAHLRKDDIDHVKCERGDLRGVEAACANEFTGTLTGDAYNFTYYSLKRLYEASETDPALNRKAIRSQIKDVLKNNFNQVPEEVLAEWQ